MAKVWLQHVRFQDIKLANKKQIVCGLQWKMVLINKIKSSINQPQDLSATFAAIDAHFPESIFSWQSELFIRSSSALFYQNHLMTCSSCYKNIFLKKWPSFLLTDVVVLKQDSITMQIVKRIKQLVCKIQIRKCNWILFLLVNTISKYVANNTRLSQNDKRVEMLCSICIFWC